MTNSIESTKVSVDGWPPPTPMGGRHFTRSRGRTAVYLSDPYLLRRSLGALFIEPDSAWRKPGKFPGF